MKDPKKLIQKKNLKLSEMMEFLNTPSKYTTTWGENCSSLDVKDAKLVTFLIDNELLKNI